MNGRDVDNTNTEQFVARGRNVLPACRPGPSQTVKADAPAHAGRGTNVFLAASRPKGESFIPSMILSAFRTGKTFAQLSSLKTQTASEVGSPLTLEQNDSLGGVANDNGVVTIREAGTYFVIAGGEAGGMAPARSGSGCAQNGKDVDNSNTEQSISAGSTAVVICQSVMELEAGDTIQVVTVGPGRSVGDGVHPEGDRSGRAQRHPLPVHDRLIQLSEYDRPIRDPGASESSAVSSHRHDRGPDRVNFYPGV